MDSNSKSKLYVTFVNPWKFKFAINQTIINQEPLDWKLFIFFLNFSAELLFA